MNIVDFPASHGLISGGSVMLTIQCQLDIDTGLVAVQPIWVEYVPPIWVAKLSDIPEILRMICVNFPQETHMLRGAWACIPIIYIYLLYIYILYYIYYYTYYYIYIILYIYHAIYGDWSRDPRKESCLLRPFMLCFEVAKSYFWSLGKMAVSGRNNFDPLP